MDFVLCVIVLLGVFFWLMVVLLLVQCVSKVSVEAWGLLSQGSTRLPQKVIELGLPTVRLLPLLEDGFEVVTVF